MDRNLTSYCIILIIGREWHEIDYSGESMTWQKQKIKYAPYGISNFKTLSTDPIKL